MTALRPAILGTTPEGTAFAIDVDELVGAHLALIANSGAGKSRSVRKILEATHGRIQHIVLDDEGEFYTLRERFPYVIIGGRNGDCPATPDNAEALALALLENGLSAIVQTGALTAEEGQVFVARFLGALLKAPEALWHPVLVVLDEAQRFAPGDTKVASSDAVAEFASAARKRDFTLVVATGRFSSISTKVRAHCVNWLVGRCGLQLDRRTASAELGFLPASSEAKGLSNMPRGALWAFGPALAPVPTLVQFGDVETTHRQRGQARAPTPPAPQKLKKILAALTAAAAAPTSVSAPIKRPENGSDPQATPAEIAAADRQGYERGLEEGLRRVGAFAERLAQDAGDALKPAIAVLQRYADVAATGAWALPAGPSAEPRPPAPEKPRARAAPAAPQTAAPTAAPDEAAAEGKGPLTPARQRILDAIAWANATGQAEPTRAVIAFLAGVSSSGGGFRHNISALHTMGLIAYPRSGAMMLTAAGRGRAMPPAAALDHAAMMARIRTVLAPAPMRLLDAAIDVHPDPILREDLAAVVQVQATSGGFRNNVSRLSSLGLLTYPAPGFVRAADLLFPGEARSQ